MLQIVIFLLQLLNAASPSVKTNKFDSLPSKMVYFDKDKVVFKLIKQAILLQESRNVWFSGDKGESWNKVEKVPEAQILLQEHPYEPKTVYIFSNLQLLLSTDEGSTWTLSQFPSQLASLAKGNFAFHAKDPNKAIFQLKKCEKSICRHDVIIWFNFTVILYHGRI
jgi:Sortilin, neurotensin receptor 3,